KQNQKASRMLEKHGGAAVGESTLASTGAFETPVAIDYGYATSHPVRAWDGSETEETADTVLGHEVLGHAWNELDESEARDYENKYLRSKHPGMKMRDRH